MEPTACAITLPSVDLRLRFGGVPGLANALMQTNRRAPVAKRQLTFGGLEAAVVELTQAVGVQKRALAGGDGWGLPALAPNDGRCE